MNPRAATILWLTLAALCGCVSISPPGVRWPDDAIVYQPTRYPHGEWNPPGLEYEDVYFYSTDGTKLHGWYCEHKDPRVVVLFCHGNAGNLTHRWPWLRLWHDKLGASVMIFDYRGYGKSEGMPSEEGIVADARAARWWLADRTGFLEQDIVLVGESLGGGVAVQLATRYHGARALVLQSTFTSLPDVANATLPLSPVGSLMRNRFDSLSAIRRYRGPLLIAHGDRDTLIPPEHARLLHDAAAGPKTLVTIPGAGHNWVPTPEYVARLDAFLDELGTKRLPPPG